MNLPKHLPTIRNASARSSVSSQGYARLRLGGLQGKLLNGTIVLTTFDLAQDTSMPLEWKVELTQVPVSHYVFGWRKLPEPLEFVPAEFEEDKHVRKHLRALLRSPFPTVTRFDWHTLCRP